jgi:predicted Zn-dependent peptidase
LPELINVIADELNRAAEDLGEVEIARARTQTKAGLLMGLEGASSRAERLASMLSAWGRIPSLEETLGKIDAVGVAEARDAAQALFSAPPTLTLYGPVERAIALDALTARLVA